MITIDVIVLKVMIDTRAITAVMAIIAVITVMALMATMALTLPPRGC